MFSESLRRATEGFVSLSGAQVAALEAHFELLTRWNKKLNITTIENAEEAITRHYGEALFLGAHLPAGELRIVDIGSGGGFPGIPVAVLRPECTITLVESHQRKAVFLKEATRGTANVRVLARRAEDVAEEFDWAISRAVSYADLSSVLARLAPRAALLTGGAEPADLGMKWGSATALPWGRERFLRIGTR